MKIHNPVRRILFTVLVVSALTCASVQAQYPLTFDNPASFVQSSGFPSFGTYGLDNPGSPQVPNVRFDFGSPAATVTHSIGWSSQDAANNIGSGSMQLSWNWNHAADGDGAAAFTIDLYSLSAISFASLSFDVRVDPASAADLYNGYGYFEVVSRDGGYGYNKIPTFNTELGNPTYSQNIAGTWEHFVIPLTGIYQPIRAITFQDYNDASRNINGTVTIQIDNLTLTPVPEPSTTALLGLGLCGALIRVIRRQKK